MTSQTLRRIALGAAVPLTLSLAACGSSGSSVTTAAAAPTTASGSSSGATAAPKAGSQISSARFVSLMKAAAKKITTVKVSLTGDTSGQSYSMKGEMDLTGAKPAMEMGMNMTSSGLSGVQMRLVDGTLYMSLGSMSQGKFVKIDLSKPGNPLGSVGSSLGQLDPSQMLSKLSPGAFQRVTYLGTDQHGRHYHATLVTAKASQLKGLPSSATANLPKTMAYDVWLDDQGRFSSFRASVPKVMSLSATYSDYGAPVHISAPPASQVTQLPSSAPSL